MTAPAPKPPPGEVTPAHDAFISYSRKDTLFAARLQQALQKYVPPAGVGRERRRLRVFRDAYDFTGTEYYAAIQRHLAGARKLIVVCSPDAASSLYVNDEIERFVALYGPEHLVPVLWRGLPNNEATGETAAESAFPPALTRALEMPLAADFRGTDPRSRRFARGAGEGAWMLLLANLLDVSRAEIERRELRRRRRRRRIWTAVVAAVFAALSALTVWALFEGERALARQFAAEAALAGELDAERVERRVLLARESLYRLARLRQPTVEAQSALREALSQTPRRRLALPAADRVVAFAADGNHLLAGEGRRLEVHSLDGGVLREMSLERPLRSLAAGADHRFVAGIDDGGGARAWSWPDLRPVTALPPEVAAAPVDCLALADGGAEAVVLRLGSGPALDAELLHWRLGEPALIERAAVALAAPLRARPDDRCLIVRRHATMAGEVVIASLEPAAPAEDPAVAGTVLAWRLRGPHDLLPGSAAPVEAWPGVRSAEADPNAGAVLLLPDGRLRRAADPDTGGVRVVAEGSSYEDLAAGGAWVATSRVLEDPYVPLLRSTRFDVVEPSHGAVLVSIGDHAGRARFTPDGATLVTMAGERLRLWDRGDGHERLRLFAAADVERLLFDPSSRQLAALAADGALEVFDVGEPDEALRAAQGTVVEPLGAGGAAIARGRQLVLTGEAGATPRGLTLDGYAERMRASPDGRWLAVVVAPEDRLLRWVDPPDARLLLVNAVDAPSVRWHGPVAQQLLFDRASRRLLAVDGDGLRLVDLASGSVAWEHHLDPPPHAVAFSEDGEVVAIGGDGGLVLLSGRDGRPLRRDAVATRAVALSADGRLLARLSASDEVWVEQAPDGRRVAQLDRRGVADIRDLIFSPGGRRLMAVGGTRYSTFFVGGFFVEEHLLVWNLESGEPELRLPDSRIDAGDYQASVGSRGDERRQLSGIAWNAHTREVAGILYPSMLAYQTVPETMVPGRLTVWRLTDEGLVETYRGGERRGLRTAGFAAGGGSLLVSGDDGYVRLVHLSGPRLLQASCAAVRREWSTEELRRYFGRTWRRPLRCEGAP